MQKIPILKKGKSKNKDIIPKLSTPNEHEKKVSVKIEIEELPLPKLHQGLPIQTSFAVLLGSKCFYCKKNLQHKVKRVTCNKCLMNYCWECIKLVHEYYDSHCLRCYEFDNFTPLYDNLFVKKEVLQPPLLKKKESLGI